MSARYLKTWLEENFQTQVCVLLKPANLRGKVGHFVLSRGWPLLKRAVTPPSIPSFLPSLCYASALTDTLPNELIENAADAVTEQ